MAAIEWFNADAFAVPGPAPQALGNGAVGIVGGPGGATFDFSIAKNSNVDENRYFQFRSEFFNALNHPNFGQRISGGKQPRSVKFFLPAMLGSFQFR
jgi:hypothetical protein